MSDFIKDYLQNPSLAIEDARNSVKSWSDTVDDETVYSQISSPEFRLYEEIVLYV